MKLKRLSVAAFAGLSLSMIALAVIVALSSRPVSPPQCPEPVVRDGVRIGTQCVGGLLPGVLVILIAVGLVGSLIAWGILNRRDQAV